MEREDGVRKEGENVREKELGPGLIELIGEICPWTKLNKLGSRSGSMRSF